jgi:L-rhamnose-H+ transport protein
MPPNPFLGVFFHWLGGLASASFYVPYRGVKKWAWETYWLVGGVFSWIIAPWVLAFALTPDPLGVLRQAPGSTLFWSYFFGVLWGAGGLTFGLTMRYLGMSLGMAVALGYCTVFGTLMPPIFKGEFMSKVLGTPSGVVILIGIGVCALGIAVAGLAGISKEREMSEDQKKATIKEFNFKKGLAFATFSGVMSACFSYGLAAGDPIKKIALEHGTGTLWQGLPVLIVVLLGGFTTNFIWCLLLNVRHKTGYQYFSHTLRGPLPKAEHEMISATAFDAPSVKLFGRQKASRMEAWVSLTAEMKRKGVGLRNYSLEVTEQVASGKIAEGLQMPAGTAVKCLDQIRGWDDKPMLQSRSWFHPRLKLSGQEDFRRPLYELLKDETGINADNAHEEFLAVPADAKLAYQLEIKEGAPLLLRRRTVSDSSRRPIDYAEIYYRTEAFYLTLDSTLRSHAPSEEVAEQPGQQSAKPLSASMLSTESVRADANTKRRVPLVANYALCALAGVLWYLQFFFYTMGESQMGAYGFSSWTLHMASIIIFSSLWGIALLEWKGVSTRTKMLLAAGLALLVLSTVIVGYGNYVGANATH